MRLRFRRSDPSKPLLLSVHGNARAWVDGVRALEIADGGSWTRSALFQRHELVTPADDGWHQLDLEVGWSGIDWECYLASTGNVTWSDATIWEEAQYGCCDPAAEVPAQAFQSALRRHVWPWMSQITVGLAAVHGLLEETEARSFLRECLPESYVFPFSKRTTPFFAKIEDMQSDNSVHRILPCNVPASMYYFCHALRRYGMECEARDLLVPIYKGMLDRGASTWWEEWNTRSSLCHAWACFVVEFLDSD
jgi:hypothetical protein